MRLTANGARFIASFEGFRPYPYRDAVGVWTIGYGHTHGVSSRTPHISEARARTILDRDADPVEAAIRRIVRVPINQCEFNALVSLGFNIGVGGLSKSTVIKRLNKGQRVAAGAAFLMWNKGAGRVLPGLTRRRWAERKLFRGKLKGHTKCGRRVRV